MGCPDVQYRVPSRVCRFSYFISLFVDVASLFTRLLFLRCQLCHHFLLLLFRVRSFVYYLSFFFCLPVKHFFVEFLFHQSSFPHRLYHDCTCRTVNIVCVIDAAIVAM